MCSILNSTANAYAGVSNRLEMCSSYARMCHVAQQLVTIDKLEMCDSGQLSPRVDSGINIETSMSTCPRQMFNLDVLCYDCM